MNFDFKASLEPITNLPDKTLNKLAKATVIEFTKVLLVVDITTALPLVIYILIYLNWCITLFPGRCTPYATYIYVDRGEQCKLIKVVGSLRQTDNSVLLFMRKLWLYWILCDDIPLTSTFLINVIYAWICIVNWSIIRFNLSPFFHLYVYPYALHAISLHLENLVQFFVVKLIMPAMV